MIFNSSERHLKNQFIIESQLLESVNTFCYFGFEVKPNGTVKHAMDTLHEKAKSVPFQGLIYRLKRPLDYSIPLYPQ